MEFQQKSKPQRVPWNKGRICGRKAPLKLKEIWAIRFRLQDSGRLRELTLFNLAIDSKLRGCDLVRLKINDVSQAGRVLSRTTVVQRKTKQPVQFEIMEQSRDCVASWMAQMQLRAGDYLFPSRFTHSSHLSTRQYARLVNTWVSEIGLDPSAYGTHSLRRTKPTLIYQRTKNLRAIQLLLGHTKLESTIRYLGVEVEDALEIAEQTDI
jgi:integrase